MWLVPDKFEIFEFEIVDVFDGRIQFQPGKGRQLRVSCSRLLEMILVKMQIAKRLHEVAGHKMDNLRNTLLRARSEIGTTTQC